MTIRDWATDIRIALRVCAAGLATAVVPMPFAMAAPEEIEVYMDDLSAPGQFGLDLHNNYVISGNDPDRYPGEQAPAHVYRLTPEVYFGLTDTLELGAYLLGTRAASGETHYAGEKLRIKFVAPHDAAAGSFWGANLEFGRTGRLVSENPWNAELKGIWGYRAGAWTVALNPNIDWILAAHGGPPEGEVDVKIAYELRSRLQVGVETYDELGPVAGPVSWRKNSQVTYLALDRDFGGWDLNAGVGHGWTRESDQWVFKFIIGMHFGGR
jgi:hypothetical protein